MSLSPLRQAPRPCATALIRTVCLIAWVLMGLDAVEQSAIEIEQGVYADQSGEPSVLYEPHADTLSVETLKLVPTGAATCVATSDGAWSDAGTWSGGVPGNGDRVHVPAGISVVYDRDTSAAIEWIRVDGTAYSSIATAAGTPIASRACARTARLATASTSTAATS